MGTPIQLIYQLWLALNGIVTLEWARVFTLGLTDWEGNRIFLPLTAGFCIAMSMLTILKTMVELNNVRIHVQCMATLRKAVEFTVVSLDYLPFLASSAFFR